MAKYDIAISFAGEQRNVAESIATRLDAAGYSVFYDLFEQAELWGRDLSISLGRVDSEEARFCLVVVSDDYVKKAWTNLERQNAISRFMRTHDNYILCLKTDDASLPGLPDVIGYVTLSETTGNDVFELLLRKLGKPSQDDFISHPSGKDQQTAREIIEACFRRAIFTRMQSEIQMDAMNRSLADALGRVQRLASTISDPSLGHAANKIVAALDHIERISSSHHEQYSYSFPPDAISEIDDLKVQIIRLLLEIRRAAKIPIQLPHNLRIDHFFDQAAADTSPQPMHG